MLFCDIPQQAEAARTLRAMIDHERMPHALLLYGRERSGALSLALAAAQYLLCTHRTPEGEPCGSCPHCLQMQRFGHPDMHFVFPVVNAKSGQTADNAATSDDYLDEWRSALRENPDMTYTEWVSRISSEGKNAQIYQNEANKIIQKLSRKPFESDDRVMLIWLPERLNEQASNHLLKIIEEPYPHTYFLLVTQDPDRVLGTIVSRCQRLTLPPTDPTWKQPHFGTEEEQFFFDKFCALMRQAYSREIYALRDWANEMAATGRRQSQDFLQYAQTLLRENYVLGLMSATANGNNAITYLSPQAAAFASRFHPFINAHNVERIMKLFSDAEGDIAQNGAAKVIFFDLALQLIMALKPL